MQNQNGKIHKRKQQQQNKNLFKANKYKKDRKGNTESGLILFFFSISLLSQLVNSYKLKQNQFNAIELYEYDQKNKSELLRIFMR